MSFVSYLYNDIIIGGDYNVILFVVHFVLLSIRSIIIKFKYNNKVGNVESVLNVILKHSANIMTYKQCKYKRY